jgi:SAM-dependent methyltransferase
MLKSLLDAVMERRARQLMELVGAWLPTKGPVLDLGSGTGHLSARVERELGLEVVTVDVSDMHVVGRPPVLIAEGILPFEDGTFSAALLIFMLAYPDDAPDILAEAARVTQGPIILVQTLHSGRLGYAWFRVREFFWATVPRFEVPRLRLSRGGVHHGCPALLYCRGASAGCGGGRAAHPVAAGATSITRPLAFCRRVDPGAR